MDKDYTNSDKARDIIKEVIYITLATSSMDGQPWNSPVYSAFDESYNFYWVSDKNAQHSKNITNNAQVFIVIYNSTAKEGTGGGVYIKAKAQEILDEKDIEAALSLLYARKNKAPREVKEFLGEYPRRVYKATPEFTWINGSADVNGNYIDTKIEVNLLKK